MKDGSVNPDNGAVSDSTSSVLLARLKARDPEAWRRLAVLYGPLVYGWCRRRGLQAEDAADVVQEVFWAVARTVAGFRHEPGGSFRGWLWTITLSKLRDHHRRRGSRPVAVGGSDAQQRLLEVPFAEGEEPTERDDAGALVRRALELIRVEFEARTWQAFWRAAVDGHTPADIAAELGMSANAVYVAKSRVLRRLREELGG